MNVNVFLLMYSPFFVFCFLNTKEDVFFYANSLIANCGDFLYKMFMNFANGKNYHFSLSAVLLFQRCLLVARTFNDISLQM